MYKAIIAFTDLQDANHIYHTGDTYPRDGLDPSQERIDELSGSANKVGCPLIAKVKAIEPGKTSPRRSQKKDPERIKESSTNASKAGKPLTKAAE